MTVNINSPQSLFGNDALGVHRPQPAMPREVMERAEQTVYRQVPPEDIRMVLEMLFQPPKETRYGTDGRRLYARDRNR